MSLGCPSDPLAGSGHLDPVLFGVLTAAVEEESALAYEAGFADGLRAARFHDGVDGDDLPTEGGSLAAPDLPVLWTTTSPSAEQRMIGG